MTTRPRITLSVVSHGDADKIARLLASVRKHENAANFQILITDNLKDDLPSFDSANWQELQILRNDRPLGFAENHNRAFALAHGEYFAVLNPDLIFTQPVFESLINSLNAASLDLIAPAIVDENGHLQDSYRALPTPLELVRRRLPNYAPQLPPPNADGMIYPDWLAGMFWLMSAQTYRQLGGMDEKFRLYFEDVDFCARARIAKMKIALNANLQVRHDAQRASRRKIKFLFLHLQSAAKFFASPVYRQARRLAKLPK
ncbi:MAG: glycosyltransferase [Anaerolineales bacterium]|nr:glycosyltransferase [Anaerolineales bacterium]